MRPILPGEDKPNGVLLVGDTLEHVHPVNVIDVARMVDAARAYVARRMPALSRLRLGTFPSS